MDDTKKIIFNNVDEYLDAQLSEIRKKLSYVRKLVKKTIPEAQEVISYAMPAFKFHGMLLHYAPFKNHYGLFIKPNVLAQYKSQLSNYKTAKATLQIQYNQELPEALFIQMIKDCAQANLDNKVKKLQNK